MANAEYDGFWQGVHSGVQGPQNPWLHHMQALLVGHEAYEGLSALLFYDGDYTFERFEGLIFEGEMPLMPEPVAE